MLVSAFYACRSASGGASDLAPIEGRNCEVEWPAERPFSGSACGTGEPPEETWRSVWLPPTKATNEGRNGS